MATHLLSLLLLAAVMPDSHGSRLLGGLDSHGSRLLGGRPEFLNTPGPQRVVFQGHGTAGASSNWPSNPPIKAFQPGGGFWLSGTGSIPQALWFKFNFVKRIVAYSFNSRPSPPHETVSDGPSEFSFWGSNADDCSDQSQWAILHVDKSGPFTQDNDPKKGSFTNSEGYLCYGFYVTAVPGRKPGTAYAGQKFAAIANVNWLEIPPVQGTNPGLHSFRAA